MKKICLINSFLFLLFGCDDSVDHSLIAIELVQNSKVFEEQSINEDYKDITWKMYTDLLQLQYPDQKVEWFSKKVNGDKNQFYVGYIAPRGVSQMWEVFTQAGKVKHKYKNNEYFSELEKYYTKLSKETIENACRLDTDISWTVISKVLRGDFDSDGKRDYAARVQNTKNKKTMVAVLHKAGNEIHWLNDYGNNGFRIEESYKMRGWLKRKVGDGIFMFWHGAAHPVTFYFDKEDGRYTDCQYCY